MKKRIGNPQKVHGQAGKRNSLLNRDRRSRHTGFKFGWLLFALFFCNSLLAQNVAINADGSKPNANAMLDIKSANKGLLIPRMTTDARLRIEPTQGLMVYDVNTNSFWYNTGKNWQSIAATSEALAVDPSTAWMVTGNAGTVDGTNFIGTTDNVPFNVRVNNQRSGRIDHLLDNTFWGYKSGNAAPTGKNNTGIGSQALLQTTTGFDNTAVGSLAMLYNTVGFSNTALGRFALQNNSRGNYNTALGQSALIGNTTGSENVAVGVGALFSNNASNGNTAVGTNSQFFGGGSQNTSVGLYSMGAYTTGNNNSALGAYANPTISLGNNNNTAVGHSAINWEGSNSTALGSSASTHGNNSMALGSGAVSNAANKVRIGNAAVTVIEGQVPFTFPSDGRFKFGVQEDVKGLDFILQLRPVTYNFDTKRFDEQVGQKTTASDEAYATATSIRRTGFIAQEVEQAAIKSGYDFSGVIRPRNAQEHYSLSYDAFVVPLVKAVQEQQQVIDQQRSQISEQQKINEAQNKKLAGMQAQLDELQKLLKARSN